MLSIDLGSNTIRFIEFDGVSWGKNFEKIVRTAQGLEITQEVSDEALYRIISAITEAKNIFDFNQPIVGVTTAAIRMALNSKSVIQKIFDHTGINFQIIDGIKEANLTLMAVQYRLQSLKHTNKDFCLLDIGGASTELTYVSKTFQNSISLNIGILTMSEKSLNGYSLDTLLLDFETELSIFISKCPKIDSLVLSSGTPTTIAAYLLGMNYESYKPEKVNGFILSQNDCKRVLNELIEMDEARRSFFVGVGREELIITGILMVISVFNALNLPSAIVIDDGLREGVALNYYFPDQLPHLT